MDINEIAENALKGTPRTELLVGEAILKYNLMYWQINYFRTVPVDVYLTNYRLIIQDNEKTNNMWVVSSGLGAGIAGGLTQGMTGAATGFTVGALAQDHASSSPDGGIIIPLDQINGLLAAKYKLYGIPTRDNTLKILVKPDITISLSIGNKSQRDEWLSSIRTAQSSIATNPPNSNTEIKNNQI